jgi:four helix bundle protein
MGLKSYDELLAWQRGMDLVEEIYRATAAFPKDEMYGLTGQLRRAAVSIPSNIAEGQGRRSTREFSNFLSIARGSLAEVETQLQVALRLNYFGKSEAATLLARAAEVGRLISGLARSLTVNRRPSHQPPATSH